ncbi:HAD-IB family hydrolase [Streptomyces sp. MJP52]|uniref:HAD family hydrolase n=1 Tax=Streptomyces sp. MJP52 TaxID=2940555 RepID=UPI002474ABF8|nr:HAD-IB family hydrolase [Streptomyces sp. MJP52]MDH6224190.1 HAD superfamily hydrolase (TIGR01490 family) [Streptomyces sp. MJP52]
MTIEPLFPLDDPTPAYLVFCDIDDTLIRCRSGVEFLRHYAGSRHGAEGERATDELLADLYARMARGMSREEANREYHRAWRRSPVDEVEEHAARWYEQRSAAADFYITETVDALRRHRAAGAAVALVSGSFPLLMPHVARAVGAQYVLGARLERCGRVLTGELLGRPAIGEGKCVLVNELLGLHPRITPEDCHAYGDHESDLPMLNMVGHATLVAPDGSHAPVRPAVMA